VHQFSAPPTTNTGPPVTVFVGNITERANDGMIRHILTTMGPIQSWKRVQGATGRLQAFGFCEYANPDAAARAIRLLHDMLIGDKKLVVKVDSKTKDVLEAFKRERRKELSGKSPTQAEKEKETADADIMDPAMKEADDQANGRVRVILQDNAEDMMNYVPREQRFGRGNYRDGLPFDRDFKPRDSRDTLEDMQLEEGRKEIVHREIDRFRETMKKREEEKREAERKKAEEDATKKDTTAGPPPPEDENSKVSTLRSVSPVSPHPHKITAKIDIMA